MTGQERLRFSTSSGELAGGAASSSLAPRGDDDVARRSYSSAFPRRVRVVSACVRLYRAGPARSCTCVHLVNAMSLRAAPLPCRVRAAASATRARSAPHAAARVDAASRCAPRVGCAAHAVAAAAPARASCALPQQPGFWSAQCSRGAVAAGRTRRARSFRAAASVPEAAEATPPEVDDETLDQLIAVRAHCATPGQPAALPARRSRFGPRSCEGCAVRAFPGADAPPLACRSSARVQRMTGAACLQSAWSGPSWGRAYSCALSSRRLPRPVTTSSRCWCVLGPAVTRCQACC